MIELLAGTYFVAIFVILVAFKRLSFIDKRTEPISRLEAKLDLLLKQAGIEFDSGKHTLDQVTAALQRGEKIQAIRYYREATGVGLKEAKEFVETIQSKA